MDKVKVHQIELAARWHSLIFAMASKCVNWLVTILFWIFRRIVIIRQTPKMYRSKNVVLRKQWHVNQNVCLFEGRTMIRNVHQANWKSRDKTDYIQFAVVRTNVILHTHTYCLTHMHTSIRPFYSGLGIVFLLHWKYFVLVRRVYRSFAFNAGFACTFNIYVCTRVLGWGE